MSLRQQNLQLRYELALERQRERDARWLLPEWPTELPYWAPELAKSRWRYE